MTSRGAAALFVLALAGMAASESARLRLVQTIDSDEKGLGLKQPQGVACDGKGLLAIADSGNHRLLRFMIAGERVTPAGEIRLDEIPYPIKVQIDPQGDWLALDGKSRRIARIAAGGAFKGYVQPAGQGALGLSIPRSFVVDGEGSLYVLDVFQARIVVLNREGRALRQIGFPKDAGFLSDLAVDDQGTVFAVDSVGRRVFTAKRTDNLLLPLTGDMKKDLAFPTAIAIDGRGRVLLADQNEGGLVLLGRDGVLLGRQAGLGWKPGALRSPSGLCRGIGDTIFVADRDNNRVQMFAVSQ